MKITSMIRCLAGALVVTLFAACTDPVEDLVGTPDSETNVQPTDDASVMIASCWLTPIQCNMILAAIMFMQGDSNILCQSLGRQAEARFFHETAGFFPMEPAYRAPGKMGAVHYNKITKQPDGASAGATWLDWTQIQAGGMANTQGLMQIIAHEEIHQPPIALPGSDPGWDFWGNLPCVHPGEHGGSPVINNVYAEY